MGVRRGARRAPRRGPPGRRRRRTRHYLFYKFLLPFNHAPFCLSFSLAWTSSAVAALLGVLIAGVSTGRVRRRVLLIVAAVIILFFLSLFAFRVLHYVFNPLVPSLAMIIASELAVGVNRARQARLA